MPIILEIVFRWFSFSWFLSSSSRTQARAVWILGVRELMIICRTFISHICAFCLQNFLTTRPDPSQYPNFFASTRPVPSRSQKPLPVGPCPSHVSFLGVASMDSFLITIELLQNILWMMSYTFSKYFNFEQTLECISKNFLHTKQVLEASKNLHRQTMFLVKRVPPVCGRNPNDTENKDDVIGPSHVMYAPK